MRKNRACAISIAIVAVGWIVLPASVGEAARIEVPIGFRLAHSVEFAYVVDVTAATEKRVDFKVKEVLRQTRKSQPPLDVFRPPVKTGLYLALVSDNHHVDPKSNEYQWQFYPIESKDGVRFVKRITPDRHRPRSRYVDLPLAEVKLLVILHPFAPQDGRKKIKVDYQKLADVAEWTWRDYLTSPMYSLMTAPEQYAVAVTRDANGPLAGADPTILNEYRLKYSVSKGRRELYSWKSHAKSLFQIRGDRLFAWYGNYRVTCVDLKTGKPQWDTTLKGFGYGRGPTQPYPINVHIGQDVIVVFGQFGKERFVEIHDIESRRLLGHRMLGREGNRGTRIKR